MADKEDDDKAVLISMRVNDMGQPVPGATQRKCSNCDFPVWFAPSSLLVPEFVGRDLQILCTHCAFDLEVFNDPGAQLIPPTDEQLAEIEAALKKDQH